MTVCTFFHLKLLVRNLRRESTLPSKRCLCGTWLLSRIRRNLRKNRVIVDNKSYRTWSKWRLTWTPRLLRNVTLSRSNRRWIEVSVSRKSLALYREWVMMRMGEGNDRMTDGESSRGITSTKSRIKRRRIRCIHYLMGSNWRRYISW